MYKNIASWSLEKIQRKSTVWMNQSNNDCKKKKWKTGALLVSYLSTYINLYHKKPNRNPKAKTQSKARET